MRRLGFAQPNEIHSAVGFHHIQPNRQEEICQSTQERRSSWVEAILATWEKPKHLSMISKIQPLSKQTLAAAIVLANKVFRYQRWWEKASWAFQLSLMDNHFSKLVLGLVGIRWCRYWVALSLQADVIGVTGLYTLRGESETCWLGWTCVEPEARGQGIGSQLIDFAIAKARDLGTTYLKVYTSDIPDYTKARQLYEQRGFKLIQQTPGRYKQMSFNIFYYQLQLN